MNKLEQTVTELLDATDPYISALESRDDAVDLEEMLTTSEIRRATNEITD